MCDYHDDLEWLGNEQLGKLANQPDTSLGTLTLLVLACLLPVLLFFLVFLFFLTMPFKVVASLIEELI